MVRYLAPGEPWSQRVAPEPGPAQLTAVAWDPMTTRQHDRPVGIITPEAVVLEFETAGVASRLLARLVDGLVLWAGLVGFAIAMGSAGPLASDAVAIILLVLILFFVVFGYWVLSETLLQGRTLGKMALGLRVVTVEGAPVQFRHAAIRAIVGLVDFLLPPLGPVAVVSVLLSPQDQRLGDLAAGTIVLRERSAIAPQYTVHLTEPAGQQELMGKLQMARITEAQHSLIRRFLIRTATLTPDARAQLAGELAVALETATGVGRTPDLHPEWYLHAVGLAHQRRSGMAQMPTFAVGSAPAPPVGLPVVVGAPLLPPTAYGSASSPPARTASLTPSVSGSSLPAPGAAPSPPSAPPADPTGRPNPPPTP